MYRPCAQLDLISIDSRKGMTYRLTLLALTKTLDDHQYLRSHNIVAAVDEVLKRHQVGHLATLTVSKWTFEHSPVIAVLMNHEMATAISLGEQ
jgi:hypothetical protein